MLNRTFPAVSVLGISIILLLTVVGLASKADQVQAAPARADAPTTPSITVSGTGRVGGTPDQSTITIGVQITVATLADATAQTSAAMTKVLDAIKAQGVDAKDIQTSTYSVNPINTYKEDQTATVTGYQVMNIVTARVRNLANASKVLDAGMGAGANYLGGITFETADRAPLESQARTLAVQDATHVAQVLAQASGVKLGKVLSITDVVGSFPPPIPVFRQAADSNSAGPVESGSLEITSNVQVRFEIVE